MRLAIIPARGGSKRIKNKNIKLFYNKPIIYWSIKAAKESKLFDKIIVSTDSLKIARISKKYGAEVPFIRPKIFSNDKVNTFKVVKHALKWHEERNIHFDYTCCIYPTAPFVTSKLIKRSFNVLLKRKKFFAFTAGLFSHPIHRGFNINKNNVIKAIWPNNEKKRSQDFKAVYHDIGQIYWGTNEAFIKEKKLFSKNSVPILLPKFLCHDIDNYEDWINAELMFKFIKKNGTP